MSDVIWQLNLRKGKDHPKHMDKKEYDKLGATVGTLLCLTKPVHGCGKVFVLDSGFCVLKALVELKKKGAFAHVLIKKCRYWPRHVPGDDIITHFKNEEVGKVDAIKGVLDDVPFYLLAMKEPDYVMQIMSMYGTLGNLGQEKTRHFTVNEAHQVVKFCYPKVVHNHYAYRDVIDNHNLQHMHPISMEETWMTVRWPNCVFCFLLAVTMVNVQNAGVYCYHLPKVDSLFACKLIAQQLIENRYLIVKQSARKWTWHGEMIHHLVALPTFKKFENGRLVKCKSKYQTWYCSCKQVRVRTYCAYFPGILRCQECYSEHNVESTMNDINHT